MKTKTTINVGEVENAIELVFTQGNPNHRYVLQPKSETGQYGYEEDTVSFLNRFPKHSVKRTNEHYIDDPSGEWFACYNVDCFDPPFAVIRAQTFEQAYEVFCDEFEDWLRVDPMGETDYHSAECNATNHEHCNCDISYNSSGTHIDTDNVQIHSLTLVSITCKE
jgi:hypothetical protein